LAWKPPFDVAITFYEANTEEEKATFQKGFCKLRALQPQAAKPAIYKRTGESPQATGRPE
jgi:hypothetical protein